MLNPTQRPSRSSCVLFVGLVAAAFAGCGGKEADMGQDTGSGASGGLVLGGGGSTSKAGSTSHGGSTSSGGPSSGSPAGTPCSQASDCESGKCEGELCMPTAQLPNTTCDSGPDCASGVCQSGACVIPKGASGTVDMTDCMPGSFGCMCQPKNKCMPGLTCTDNLCCNSKTGSCSPGGVQAGAGGADSGGTPSACKPGVVGPIITECGYPFASSNALTGILFNESTVLGAIVPSGGYPLASIQLF